MGTIFTGDNLPVLREMDSESVDLIYLDPPFNSNRTYSAPIGSKASGAEFKDSWTLSEADMTWHEEIADREPALYHLIAAAKYTHSDGMVAYLIMMAARLLELKRVLKPTGSIYLHCDPTASHYLKLLMDGVFGRKRYLNEIVWCYSQAGRGAKAKVKRFPRNSDVILFYTKSAEYKFNIQHSIHRIPLNGSGYQMDEQGRYFRTAQGDGYSDAGIAKLEKEGRIYRSRTGKVSVKYFEHYDGKHILERRRFGNVWVDIPDVMHIAEAEKTGYPTQKPLKLLRRIIEASSNEGDMILDPFCGSGTTLVVAEELQRQWIGIDKSEMVRELIENRLELSNKQLAL